MEEMAEIKQAKEIKAFLTDWGMKERDAKKVALQIVFKCDLDCVEFPGDQADTSSAS